MRKWGNFLSPRVAQSPAGEAPGSGTAALPGSASGAKSDAAGGDGDGGVVRGLAAKSLFAATTPVRAASVAVDAVDMGGDATRLHFGDGVSDSQRVEHARREFIHRIEAARSTFESALGVRVDGSTEAFVASLEDGKMLLAIVQRVSGLLNRPSKLDSLGIAGVSVDSFDRMQSLCKELAVRDDIVLTVVDIRTSNLAKIALFLEDMTTRLFSGREGDASTTPASIAHQQRSRRGGGLPMSTSKGTGLASLLQSRSPPVVGSSLTSTPRRLWPTSSSPSLTSGAAAGADAVQEGIAIGIANVEEKMSLKTKCNELEMRLRELSGKLENVESEKVRLTEIQLTLHNTLNMQLKREARVEQELKTREAELAAVKSDLDAMNRDWSVRQQEHDDAIAKWKQVVDRKMMTEDHIRKEKESLIDTINGLKSSDAMWRQKEQEWAAIKECFMSQIELERQRGEQCVANARRSSVASLEHVSPATCSVDIAAHALPVVLPEIDDEERRRVLAMRRAVTATAASLRQLKASVVDCSGKVKAAFRSAAGDFGSMSVDLLKMLRGAQEATTVANERYLRELKERRRVHNLLAEAKGNIRVFCRVRPPLHGELESGDSVAVTVVNDTELLVAESMDVDSTSKHTRKPAATFEYDKVFGPASSQQQVFDELSGMVTSAIDGFHSTIFAYGQTGSGKTYTMNGMRSDRGVNHRALHELFRETAERGAGFQYTFRVTMLEIYNENVVDLLSTTPSDGSRPSLEIRQGPHGICVPDAVSEEVSCIDDIEALMARGETNRSVGATQCNERSSRSHSLLLIDIAGVNKVSGGRSRGRLVLVDLAGSERVSKSGAVGSRMKEAQNINKSLSALGNVIAALATKSTHVPFRDSKLTYVLQDSLGKDNKTLMIVQVNPLASSRGESVCSLNFASRVRTVELGKARATGGDSDEVLRARAALVKAREESSALHTEVSRLTRDLESLRSSEKTLEKRSAEEKSALEERLATSTRSLQREVDSLRAELDKATAASKAEREKDRAELDVLRRAKADADAARAVAVHDAVSRAREEGERDKAAAVQEAVSRVKAEAQHLLAKKRAALATGDKAEQRPRRNSGSAATAAVPTPTPAPAPVPAGVATVAAAATPAAARAAAPAVQRPSLDAEFVVASALSDVVPKKVKVAVVPSAVLAASAAATAPEAPTPAPASSVTAADDEAPRQQRSSRGHDATPFRPKRASLFDGDDGGEDDADADDDDATTAAAAGDEWVSGADAVGRVSGTTSDDTCRARATQSEYSGSRPAGILKAANPSVTSRAESLRNASIIVGAAQRSASVYVAASSRAAAAPTAPLSATLGAPETKQKKRVTFISPTLKRSATDVVDPAEADENAAAVPHRVSDCDDDAYARECDDADDVDDAKKIGSTPRVPSKKRVKVLGMPERVLATPRRVKTVVRAEPVVTRPATAGAMPKGGWRF